MATSPRISVVVPAYNHERFVGAALESVARQTLAPGDVVVVDDGSSDGTAEVVARSGIPGLALFRQENRGAHAALNRAASEARGEWIAILNSDDVFAPERLEHALGVARATGAALVLGRVSLVGEEGDPLPADHPTAVWYREAWAHVASSPSLADALVRHNAVATTSNFFVHRELWRLVGGFRAFRYVHDLDFLLRALALAPDRVVLEESLTDVGYRVHGANTITEDVPAALEEREAMLRAHRRVASRAARVLRRPLVAGVVARGVARGLSATSHAGTRPRPAPSRAAPTLRCGLVVERLDAGGLEEVVATLATALPAHGVEPFVLCTRDGGRVADGLEAAGVPVAVARSARERARWLAEVRPRVLSTHFVDEGVLGELAGGGVPAVETIHNAYVWLSPEAWRREAAKRRWLRAFIAVSDLAGAYHRRHAGPGDLPLHVVPNGVSAERVCAVPRDFARKALGLPPSAEVLLHLGRVAPQKNQLGLLASFGDLAADRPDAVLLLAGDDGDPDYAGAVERAAAPLVRAGKVRRMSARPDVGTLLSAADVYVADSWFEGWSLAATEALWHGLPVVLSDCGGSRELVGREGERGRVVPNPGGDPLGVTLEGMASPDPDAVTRNRTSLAGALEAVLGELDGWRERGAAIRAHARREYTADRMAGRYAEVLRGVAG